MRKFVVSITCGAALALLALMPTQSEAAWFANRWVTPYTYGYYAPVGSPYYYGSYYVPSTAYYVPSTAYYVPSTAYYYPSTALYAPSLAYYYGPSYSPAVSYYALPTTSLAYYYPSVVTRPGSYTYGAYTPITTSGYYENLDNPAPTTASPAHVQEIANVSIQDDRFSPKTITVAPGTTVRWVNTGNRSHTVTSDEDRFDSGELNHNSSFSHLFDRPGTYYYHCTIEPNKMRGEVIVK